MGLHIVEGASKGNYSHIDQAHIVPFQVYPDSLKMSKLKATLCAVCWQRL